MKRNQLALAVCCPGGIVHLALLFRYKINHQRRCPGTRAGVWLHLSRFAQNSAVLAVAYRRILDMRLGLDLGDGFDDSSNLDLSKQAKDVGLRI